MPAVAAGVGQQPAQDRIDRQVVTDGAAVGDRTRRNRIGDRQLTAEIDACLARHELPRMPSDLGLSEDQFVAAVLEAPATRPDRYTVLEHLAMDEEEARTRVRAFADAYGR